MTATQPKKYFITPDFDCPPNTAIRLGLVLTSPTQPYEPLNEDANNPPPPSITITTTKSSFHATRSQLSTGTYGIWAQILDSATGAFGASVDFAHSRENGQDIEFEIDEVETTFIKQAGNASKDYMRRCVETDDVVPFFRGSLFSKPVYLITGLKVAKGAKVSYGAKKNRDTSTNSNVNATSGVKGGAKVENKTEAKETTEWRDERSFVFGYQLRRIGCKKGKMVKDEEFNRGAFLDLDSERGKKEDEQLYYEIGEEGEKVGGDVAEGFGDEECVWYLPKEANAA